MNIKSLKLVNYRNHKLLNIEFNPQVNLLIGPNGVGKTNILESIHLISTTKSFRAKYDRDLINHNEDFAKVEAKISSNGEVDDFEIQIIKNPSYDNTSSKKVKVNSSPRGLSKFAALINTVLFSPEDIDIITGSPSNRRRSMNMILFQVDKQYKKDHSDYIKVIKRRNKLLENIRDTGQGLDQLPYWNNKILEFGESIQLKREELITHLNSYLQSKDAGSISNGNKLSIEYNINKLDTRRLLEYKDIEIKAKRSLIGPHLDDFTFLQNSLDMAQFASRGEQRTAIFLLKQAEYSFINLKLGVKPILLLDDIFSELDNAHKERVLSFIKDQQTIITTASEADLPEIYIDKTIKLEK